MDGTAYIEDQYYKTGIIEKKRKNMRPIMKKEERNASGLDGDSEACNDTLSGVDLNRNYGYKWGAGSQSLYQSECIDYYHGVEPFSEPET